MIKFYTWLKQFNSFNVRDNRLRSLNSGLASSDSTSVNCDDAEKVGRNMLVCMDNKSVAEAKVKTSKKVKNLLTLTKGVQLENRTIHVDPTISFLRLIVLIERTDDTEKYFGYELTPYPTALFKDKFMRHPDKAALAEALLNYKKISKISQKRKGDKDTNGDPKRLKRKQRKVESNVEKSNDLSPEANLNNEMRQETKVKDYMTTDGKGTERERDIITSNNAAFTVDGGYLLHRVFWDGATFRDITKQYEKYLKVNYGVCTVVFDAYGKMAIKDHKHLRRLNSQQTSENVLVFEEGTVHYSKEKFLSNTKNKEQLIKLLASHFVTQGHQVLNCEEDADTQIVREALEVACRKENITVVAEDIDILVLLLYFWNTEMGEIFMTSEPRKKQEKSLSMWRGWQKT